MNARSLSLVGLALLVSSVGFGRPADQPLSRQEERVAASFVLALGRAPSPAELQTGAGQDQATVSELVARHRQQLQDDAALRRATLEKAFKDTYGRAPTNEEIGTWSQQRGTYSELMNRLIAALAEDPTEYEKMLDRVYRLVARRAVYPEEIDYWKKHGTIPYAMLVGAVEDWARRNQPGLMVTAGTPTVSINSNHLTTVRLSRAIAEEARAAAGLPSLRGHYVEADYLGSTGRNIVAPGAETIVSSGKIHFVAAGR